jgi:hypothetical protein
MREVKQKRFLAILFDKRFRLPGIPGGEMSLVNRHLNRFFVLIEFQAIRHGGDIGLVHVVAIKKSVILVEAVTARIVLGQIAEMPLAEAGCRVAFLLEGLGERNLGIHKSEWLTRKEDAHQSRAERVASGQQRGARGRTHRCRGIEVRELHAFAAHSIDVGSSNDRIAEASDVAVAHVVSQDDHDVGFARGRGGRERRGAEGQRG